MENQDLTRAKYLLREVISGLSEEEILNLNYELYKIREETNRGILEIRDAYKVYVDNGMRDSKVILSYVRAGITYKQLETFSKYILGQMQLTGNVYIKIENGEITTSVLPPK